MTFGVSMGPDASAARWSRQRWVRRGTGSLYRKLASIRFLLTRDREQVLAFLRAKYPFDFPIAARIDFLRRVTRTTNAVRGYHTLEELLRVCDRIFMLAGRPGLTVIECGAGSGSSTAKLSLAVAIAGGRLLVFDSFQGIPDNDEKHRLVDGRELVFRRGAFKGRLTAVQKRIRKYGAIEVCTFHKGLFDETLAGFDEPVDVVLLDVDLISSTRQCTSKLFPRLRSGGALFSQDGHLQATVDLYADDSYWHALEVERPNIDGLGLVKMLELSPRENQSGSGSEKASPSS